MQDGEVTGVNIFRGVFKFNKLILFFICGIIIDSANSFSPPLKVINGKLVESNDKEIRLLGFNVVDADRWVDGIKDGGGEKLVKHWKEGWKANVVRLVLRPERWYISGKVEGGNAGIQSAANQEKYLKCVDTFLKWCEKYELYVFFDAYHESGSTGGMKDHIKYARGAMSILAKRYSNVKHIFWDIYNEPYGGKWEEWVPMAQSLIDTIRNHKPACNVIFVPAQDWCTEVNFSKAKIDRGDQIGYDFHIYPHVYNSVWKKSNWEETYKSKWAFIIEQKIGPVLIGEWSARSDGSHREELTNYYPKFIKYCDKVGAHWTNWCYAPEWGGNGYLVNYGINSPEKKTEEGDSVWAYLNRHHNTIVNQGEFKMFSGSNQIRITAINSGNLSCYLKKNSDLGLRIFDLKGKLLYSRMEKTGNSEFYNVKLPTDFISNGRYLIELENAGDNKSIVMPILE